MDTEERISFLARHYRKGAFSADRTWRRLGFASSLRLRRIRVAAVVAGTIVLGATAAVVYMNQVNEEKPEVKVTAVNHVMPATHIVRTIDFEETPLPEVVDRIREVYGVEVEGVPSNAADYTLSMHYDGNAVDLIEAINEILDTRMTVKK